MAFSLRIDELQEALAKAAHPRAAHYERLLCTLADAMAGDLALSLGCETGGPATQEGAAFCGICATLHPRYRGQPLPVALESFDSAEEWEADAEAPDLPELPPEPLRTFVVMVTRDTTESATVHVTAADSETASGMAIERAGIAHGAHLQWTPDDSGGLQSDAYVTGADEASPAA